MEGFKSSIYAIIFLPRSVRRRHRGDEASFTREDDFVFKKGEVEARLFAGKGSIATGPRMGCI